MAENASLWMLVVLSVCLCWHRCGRHCRCGRKCVVVDVDGVDGVVNASVLVWLWVALLVWLLLSLSQLLALGLLLVSALLIHHIFVTFCIGNTRLLDVFT